MPVRDVRYIHAFSSRSSISATRPRRGAPALVGDLCAHHRNDTPFIATRKSIERSPPSHERTGRDMEREGERERREGRVPAGILPSQMVTTTTYPLTPSHPLCHPLCFAPAIRVDGLVNLTEIAIHLLSVCLSGSLYPRMPGPDCLPSRLHFTLLI